MIALKNQYLIVLATAACALALTACSSNPYSQQSLPKQAGGEKETTQQYPGSSADAAIIRELPSDADVENMEEQRRLVPKRLYLTWDGQLKDLDAKPVASVTADRTSFDQATAPAPAPAPRKRAVTTQESIVLDELPEPIVIE